jgi:membrane associated rhomboid family serine protease
MRNYTSFKVGPSQTPPLIRKLLFLTATVSIGTAILNPIFEKIFGIFGPESWLSLSWWGMKHYLWFQPFTSLFVQGTGFDGVSMGWLFALGFNLYLLWVFGTSVHEWVGSRSFFKLYIGSGVFAGLMTLFLMPLFGHWGNLSGAAPATLAILLVWTMMHPEGEIFIFSLIPIQAKLLFVIVAALFGINALLNSDMIRFFHLFFGVLFGYLFALLGWGFALPYDKLKMCDAFLLKWKHKIFGEKKGKIVSFETGEEMSEDDAFVDAMLKKISQKGEGALSTKERKRLDDISRRKR